MSGIMQRLREETREQHEHAESRTLEQQMLRGEIGRQAFVESLLQRHLVHRALESRVRELCERDDRLEGLVEDEQYQVPRLEADLAFFGASLENTQPTAGAARLTEALAHASAAEPVSALGFFYVFEGSKNGARFLTPRIRSALVLNGADGTRYFDPHGDRQREVWTAFRARMDAIAFADGERDAMVHAAKVAFDGVSQIDDEVHARCGGEATAGAPS